MLAIYKKELRSYFTSMIGYAFIAILLVIIGIWFTYQNLFQGYAQIEYALTGITFLFVLLVPILTMRLMAEENKQKTDQLLLTSPLSAASIVIGKFLSVFTVFGVVVAVVCTYPLILRLYGEVPFGSAYACILGFLLLGGAYLSLGLFISSLTDSQVIAAVISFITFIFTVLMDGLASTLPTDNKSAYIIFFVIAILICLLLYIVMHNLTVSIIAGIVLCGGLTAIYYIKPTLYDGLVVKVVGWLSVVTRFDNFSYGIFDLADVVYYISIIFLFLFLTTQVIKKKRWS